MEYAENYSLDETGKIILDDIYDKPDPRAYFSKLRALEYTIPERAKPLFQRVIEAYRSCRDTVPVKAIDLGCSYGVNAALLKCDLSMDDLYRRYAGSQARTFARDELLARDQDYYGAQIGDDHLEIIGIDAAARAVGYACEATLLDQGITANLEEDVLEPRTGSCLADSDLVISTGCIGYVTDRSLDQIHDACAQRRPWMAHFALRMFPYDPFVETLAQRGYVTETLPATFPQRRFASPEEREHVLDRLNEHGVDPHGKEDEGWLHASFFLSRPQADARALPLERILAS